MPRYLFKRDTFDGNKLWDANEPADITDVFQPPRDAQVWDGKKFVPVPLEEGKTPDDKTPKVVDMDALQSLAGDIPDDQEVEREVFSTPKATQRKK